MMSLRKHTGNGGVGARATLMNSTTAHGRKRIHGKTNGQSARVARAGGSGREAGRVCGRRSGEEEGQREEEGGRQAQTLEDESDRSQAHALGRVQQQYEGGEPLPICGEGGRGESGG